MRWLWALILIAGGLPAQEKSAPPPEVDAALRDRIQRFFQAHVDGKFRAADQFVAEDSKDIFFAADKPRYLGFDINSITYTEHFTRATALVTCEQEIMMPIGGQVKMKFPRSSLWKLVDGQWFWYVPQTSGVQTPFGVMGPGPARGAAPAPAAKGPSVADVMNMVKSDRGEITLSAGQPSAEVVLTNQMPGYVTLTVDSPAIPGLETKLDRTQLGPNEVAHLVVKTAGKAAGPRPPVTVEVRIDPAGQVIPIRVNFAAPPETAK